MHSFGHRANAVATFAVTILAAMCFAASFSDHFNSPSPTASVKVNLAGGRARAPPRRSISLNPLLASPVPISANIIRRRLLDLCALPA